jgi:glycosyltransferase involved in cell wall biosynthesis
LHFFGGADADDFLRVCIEYGIPRLLVNHYSNDRYLHMAIRKHVMMSDAVSGVNGLQVPSYLEGKFTNLSDGIDLEFFRNERARPLQVVGKLPIILLPARVIREKGHLDLVRVLDLLRSRGIECLVAFAGRVDSSGFVDELRAKIERCSLVQNVRFLGALDMEELRDWYAASAILAFPTYHHEGLPRIILEAQSMKLPVVAYDIGGVAEGIVNGTTGYVVRLGDITTMAERLAELLQSTHLRKSMGERGRANAEANFGLQSMADRHWQFYSAHLTKARKANAS